MAENIRNIAIIAHVDHGKTTLVDGLLKQSKTFRENESYMDQDLILDSNDQERERGITISAKSISISYKGTTINIVDTPGHADFGGEVERTLNMVDGALLLVDAQEGPMPQTKFVLKKALEMKLKLIVVVNKIDKKSANIDQTLNNIYDLFLELATDESQLEFPIIYAIGRDEKAWHEFPSTIDDTGDLTPIFDTVLEYIPAPVTDLGSPFQMLVTSLDWDTYKGKYAVGRISTGVVNVGDEVLLLNGTTQEKAKVEKIYVNTGLSRTEKQSASSGEIVLLTGLSNASIGNTISSPLNTTPLPAMSIAEPTLSISIGPNTSPFKGQDGTYLTGRQLLSRIEKELQTNIAMRLHVSSETNFVVSGRGELHLSVFLETLRREGYELEVGKPKVVTKVVDGVTMEPIEELVIDVSEEYVGAVNAELGKRRAILTSHVMSSDSSTRLIFEISTTQLIGVKSLLATATKGTAISNSTFIRYEKQQPATQKLRKGVLIASDTGKALSYGLRVAQDKGPVFINPQTIVYEGMVVGINGRDSDLEINVCKAKQLTNMRSQGEDAIILSPSTPLSLEQALSFIEDDELLELTPKNIRIRKKILDKNARYKASKRG